MLLIPTGYQDIRIAFFSCLSCVWRAGPACPSSVRRQAVFFGNTKFNRYGRWESGSKQLKITTEKFALNPLYSSTPYISFTK